MPNHAEIQDAAEWAQSLVPHKVHYDESVTVRHLRHPGAIDPGNSHLVIMPELDPVYNARPGYKVLNVDRLIAEGDAASLERAVLAVHLADRESMDLLPGATYVPFGETTTLDQRTPDFWQGETHERLAITPSDDGITLCNLNRTDWADFYVPEGA